MIYLNNASTSYPKPKEVAAAVNDYLTHTPVSPNRDKSPSNSIIKKCKKALSQLIAAPTDDDIFFYQNATQALNQALFGIDWKLGDEVITTVTEHNSVLRPLYHLHIKYGIKIIFTPCNKHGHVDTKKLISTINNQTRLVVISHVSNVTGAEQDIKTIGRSVKNSSALFLVDTAQSLGLYPVDVQDAHIDMLAFTGHKFLYGIQGIGGLYIHKDISLTPLHYGGTGVLSERIDQPNIRPFKYESGTHNIPGIVSLYTGVQSLQKNALSIVKSHVLYLSKKLNEHKNITLHNTFESSVLSFSHATISHDDIELLLDEQFNIKIRTGLHCAPLIHSYLNSKNGTVRLSPSLYTSQSDCDVAYHAIIQTITILDGKY